MALKYEISLCSVWWCPDCEDTRYFESITAQTQYFLNLTGGVFSPLVNFPINNNVETVITYRDTSTKSIDALIASNYAVVRHKESEEGEYIYRYFFARCRQDSGRQIICELSLDDIQTNYFKYRTNINPAMINRAHLNRFVESDETHVHFNTAADSPLMILEGGQDYPKRPISIEPCEYTAYKASYNTQQGQWIFTPVDSPVQGFINEYVQYWVYIFIKYDAEYTVVKNSSAFSYFLNEKTKYFNPRNNHQQSIPDQEWAVLCYPVLKEYDNIKLYATYTQIPNKYQISQVAEKIFRQLNTDTAFYYTKVISKMPPIINYDTYTFEDNVLTLSFMTHETGEQLPHGESFGEALTIVNDPDQEDECGALIHGGISVFTNANASLGDTFNFLKSSIVGANKNINYEPKMLAENISEFVLSNGSSEYSFSPLKIGDNNISLDIYECIFPDILRQFATLNFDSLENSAYSASSFASMVGLVTTWDNTYPYTDDALQNFLANNKNFYLQRNLSILQNQANSIKDSVLIGLKSPGRGILNFATGAFNEAMNYAQSDLKIDNMRNAPDNMKNANGNAFLSAVTSKVGISYIKMDALPIYKQQFYDVVYRYGYTYKCLGNISDFDNIRHYFNYIEAEIYSIDAPISSLEEDRLKEKFRKGVRLWKSDTVQYDLENYEEWIAS